MCVHTLVHKREEKASEQARKKNTEMRDRCHTNMAFLYAICAHCECLFAHI